LSVLDSDKRLADHFGGKVGLVNPPTRQILTIRCISDTTNSVNSYLNSQTNEWPPVKTNLKLHHNKEHTAHHQVPTTTADLPPKWPLRKLLFILKYLLRMKCQLLDMVIKSREKLGNWWRMLKLKGRRGGIGMKINMRGK
jgi:hypothetical protein